MYRVFSVIFVVWLTFALAVPAVASEVSEVNSGGTSDSNLRVEIGAIEQAIGAKSTFSVYPILPEENQISDRKFFDIELKPYEMQNLMLAVKNETNSEISVQIEAITATTADNGEILYSQRGVSDESLRYSLETLISPNPKVVKIPANTEIEVAMPLRMPSKRFSGIILGALHITNVSLSDANVGGITHNFSQTIGVRITNTQHQAPLETNYQFRNAQLMAGERQVAFLCDIRNPVSEMFKDTDVSVKILRGSTEILAESRTVDFAPNAIYPLTFISEKMLPPGTYVTQTAVQYGEDGKVFLYEHEFTIEAPNEETDKVISAIGDQRRDPAEGPTDIKNLFVKYPWLVWAIISSVLMYVTICLIFSLIIHTRRKTGYESRPGSMDEGGYLS